MICVWLQKLRSSSNDSRSCLGSSRGSRCRTDVFHERDFWKEQEAMWGRWGAQGIGQLRKVMLTPPSECEVRPVFAQEPAYYRMYQRRLPDLRIMLRQF